MNKETQIILFDGFCNLCNGFVRFIIKRDPGAEFKFASLQSEYGKSLLLKLGLQPNDFNSVVYFKGDRYFLQSSAVINVLKDLGGSWKLFYVFIIIPKFIRDFFYNIIGKTRYKIFGKSDACMIPDPELKERFLG